MSTRRHFLALSSATVAASALPATLWGQFPTEVFSNANLGAYTQGLLTEATFERHVGSTFKAFLPTGSVSYLTLLSVTDRTPSSTSSSARTSSPVLGSSLRAPSLQAPTSPLTTSRSTLVIPVSSATSSAFDLSFSVSGSAIEQQSYTLDHGILGRFAAFLVPGVSASGNTCAASFNYLSGAETTAPVLPTPRGRLSFQ